MAFRRRPPALSGRNIPQEAIMELGAFSVSLAVQDIEASKVFYEKLGGPASFTIVDPDGNTILVDQHV
jgi:hypothetical protein